MMVVVKIIENANSNGRKFRKFSTQAVIWVSGKYDILFPPYIDGDMPNLTQSPLQTFLGAWSKYLPHFGFG